MLNYGWQVARGMQWLHSQVSSHWWTAATWSRYSSLIGQRCVHRDLAARNVLVCADGVVKIADFGLARNLSDSEYYRKNSDGKLPVKWMSPESLFDRKCTAMVSSEEMKKIRKCNKYYFSLQSDIWSFGVLLWEIVTWGDTPYKTVPTLEALLELVRDGYRMGRPPHCPWPLWGLIRSCWTSQPEARPGWPTLIAALLQVSSLARIMCRASNEGLRKIFCLGV